MKIKLENQEQGYDTRLEASDWRYSASIVGLVQYFKYLSRIYGGKYYEEEEEDIIYCSKDITEERYLEFAEDYFVEDMHHVQAEHMLLKEEFSEEDIKAINEKLTANTVLKKLFSKTKFNGMNKEQIKELISKNRASIIKDTFKNKKNLYANYANTNLFLINESQPHCRLLGYNVDEGRKSKSTSYQFDTSTFRKEDAIEFDMIPFAFSNTREAIFVNNNFSIKQLIQTFDKIDFVIKGGMNEGNENARAALFGAIIEGASFIDYDVEVIIKDREKAYYETLFIRKAAIEVLKDIKDKKVFAFSYQRSKDDWINIQNEVVDHILNNVLLDDLIEMSLKSGEKDGGKSKISNYVIRNFIELNLKLKGGSEMTQDMKVAYACAKEVVKKFEEQRQINKIDTYRQKLISAVVFHDYDRACEILLQLSNYSGVSFGFTYSLFEDFEQHKELAYTFINSLEKTRESGDK